MPKLKIGEKVTVGEKRKDEKRIFTNGHKVFTAQEAKRLLETQATERRTVANFENNLGSLMRPRNPILGDETPRIVYDVKGKPSHTTGSLLIPADQLEAVISHTQSSQHSMNKVSSLIRLKHKRNYQLLIHQGTEINILKRSDPRAERIASLHVLQDNIGGINTILGNKSAC